MKIQTCLGIIAGAFFALGAAELPIDGAFLEVAPDGSPVKWVAHPWEGFKPFPKFKVEPKGDNGKNILTVREIAGKSGMVVRTSKRRPGVSGDQLRVSFRARGKGTGNVSLYHYTKQGNWNRPSESRNYRLTPEWRSHIVNFTLSNGPFGETGTFDLCFGAGKGEELDLSSIQAELEPGKFRGNLAMPKQWTIFGPMKKNFAPTAAELETIPSTLDGVKGTVHVISSSRIDFAPFVGGAGQEKCGWAFAELNSPIECDYTIGAGGDWWMLLYLNGQKVFDTMTNGNQKHPFAIDNHVATVRLKKGRNILAVKLVTGRASSVLMIGGPNELRSIRSRIKLEKINWIENFDSAALRCSGNPERIQGHPTPGLLTLTGQGAFQTSTRLEIKPERSTVEPPAASGEYGAFGIRIQNFGREKRADSSLSFICTAGKKQFETKVEHQGGSDLLKITFISDGTLLGTHQLPYRVLPADFLFSARPNGSYALTVDSLADSSSNCFQGDNGFFRDLKSFDAKWVFQAAGKEPAEFVADNLLIGRAAEESKDLRIPFRVELKPKFDPVKAGWPLVFSDEFDGKELDLKKWFFSYGSLPEHLSFRDGKLVIRADWDKGKTKIQSASIYTYQDFLYGYFEARVRFRKEPGWWSAFWLCTQGPSNAFVDGFEIDIFEDYYLRPKKPGEAPGTTLDHNLHIFAAGGLKSWNYHSTLPGSIDDFHVIGCKWTPFEISYYMNGKLVSSSANHSPYQSVTFDPFHHGTGTTPLKAILSGCCGKSGGDPKLGKFPEEFLVDYVRIYQYPAADAPRVSAKIEGEDSFTAPIGGTLRIKADVKPSPVSKAKIAAVYLMDSGFTLDHKTEPPYEFSVPLTQEYYDTTQYVKAGRSGKKIDFAPSLHSYSVFAQDADGKVAFSKPIDRFLAPAAGTSTPWQGKPAAIPGRLMLPFYDEGGQNVAYFDTTPENHTDKSKTFRKGEEVDATETCIGHVQTGEWLKYTVEVKESGVYRATLHYGTPISSANHILLLVDNRPAGEFPIIAHKQDHFGIDSDSVLKGIRLDKGKHILTLIFKRGGVNLSSIDFQKE